MRWFGIGGKKKDYFDSPLPAQLESVAAIAVNSNTIIKPFVTALRDFFKSLPLFLIFAFVFLYLEMLMPVFYPHWWGSFNGRATSGILFTTFISWVFFFAAPAVYAKVFFQESPRDFGVRLPANKIKALAYLLVALCILEPYVYYCATFSNFHAYYTVENSYGPQLLLLNLLVFPCQYFAEEFFFRGYLFIGLWRRVKWHSFWITDVLFTFAHMGKPGLEILLCIPASVVFNVLTLTTRSIYPAIILHSCLGISMCLLINWH
jgi:membrane protease YdiL (CAAX protease family)